MVTQEEIEILNVGTTIRREPRIAEAKPGQYLDPPYIAIAPLTIAIEPHTRVLTAICWLLAKIPPEVTIYIPILPPWDTQKVIETAQRAVSDQVLAFIGMAGLMTMAKEIKRTQPGANVEYLKLRWKALCATHNISNFWEHQVTSSTFFEDLMSYTAVWQAWVKTQQPLRKRLLVYALCNKEENPLIQGVLAQVKMILQDYGLRSSILMEDFIAAGSRAIFLPAIAQQAWTLKKALDELRQKHGDLFPYTCIFPLEGADRLNHRNYPDLYYAAVNRAIKKELDPEGRYIMSEITTTISKDIILEQTEKSFKLQPTLDETTKKYLLDMGIDPALARRRREEYLDEDEEEEPPRRRRT